MWYLCKNNLIILVLLVQGVLVVLLPEVPLPLQDCLLPLPHFQEHRGPKRHKNGKEDCGVVIKEVGELREDAGVLELPISAVLVTHWTHGEVACSLLGADVLAHRVHGRGKGEGGVQHAENAEDGGRNQGVRVELKPGKVHRNLGTKVLLDQPHWLALGPGRQTGPLHIQHFPVIEILPPARPAPVVSIMQRVHALN